MQDKVKELNAMKETLKEIYNQVKKEPKNDAQARVQYALLKSLSQIMSNATSEPGPGFGVRG